jgi:hypothetical protein
VLFIILVIVFVIVAPLVAAFAEQSDNTVVHQDEPESLGAARTHMHPYFARVILN